jgi:hypothetical protein
MEGEVMDLKSLKSLAAFLTTELKDPDIIGVFDYQIHLTDSAFMCLFPEYNTDEERFDNYIEHSVYVGKIRVFCLDKKVLREKKEIQNKIVYDLI